MHSSTPNLSLVQLYNINMRERNLKFGKSEICRTIRSSTSSFSTVSLCGTSCCALCSPSSKVHPTDSCLSVSSTYKLQYTNFNQQSDSHAGQCALRRPAPTSTSAFGWRWTRRPRRVLLIRRLRALQLSHSMAVTKSACTSLPSSSLWLLRWVRNTRYCTSKPHSGYENILKSTYCANFGHRNLWNK